MRALLVAFITISAVRAYAANPIQIENAKPWTTTWQIYREAKHGEIEGYASAPSVNRGETIRFFVNSTDPRYQLTVFRMGWYDGAGARLLHGPVTLNAQPQPLPCPVLPNGAVECRWTESYALNIPDDADPSEWASGVYLVKLTALDTMLEKYIPFVVRDDARRSTHHFQSSVATYQAWNNWGGRSLYAVNSCSDWRAYCEDPLPGASAVSFDRPYNEGAGSGQFLWHWEFNMVRFLEREGYDVTYSTSIDTHRRGNLLLNHNDFLTAGRDELWTWQMRANIEAALASGVNLGFFSAKTCYWQMRLEQSSAGIADRVIVSYRDQASSSDPFAIDTDPSNDRYVTTRWRDAPVARPEAALIGVQQVYAAVPPAEFPDDPDDIVVAGVTAVPWAFENAGLTNGSVVPSLLGFDVDAVDASSPSNILRVARSPYVDRTNGGNVTRHSDMTVYTAPSGATVFAAGTLHWSWGLDMWNHGPARVNEAAQQMTRNILRKLAGSGALADCGFTLGTASATVPPSSGSASLTLKAGSDCDWTATSDAGWLTLSPRSGSGDATITYSWTGNAGVARTATVMLGDQSFVITQHGGTIGLQAVANIASGVSLSWTSVPDSPTYEVLRGRALTSMSVIATTTSTTHNDTSASPGVIYVYRVRERGSKLVSNYGVATMIGFTDAALAPRVTVIKAAHIAELRDAVNALREAAGLARVSFESRVSRGQPIQREDITELRTALDPARAALGLPAIQYTDGALTAGMQIRAAHVQEIRGGLR